MFEENCIKEQLINKSILYCSQIKSKAKEDISSFISCQNSLQEIQEGQKQQYGNDNDSDHNENQAYYQKDHYNKAMDAVNNFSKESSVLLQQQKQQQEKYNDINNNQNQTDKHLYDKVLDVVVNKLCYENKLFFEDDKIKSTDQIPVFNYKNLQLLKQSTDCSEIDKTTIESLTKFIEKNFYDKQNLQETWERRLEKVIHKQTFLSILLILIIICLFGIIIAIVSACVQIKKNCFKLDSFFMMITLVSISVFSCLCTLLLFQHRIEGVLFDFAIVGFMHIFLCVIYSTLQYKASNFSIQTKKIEEFKNQIIPSDLLYFELMNRKSLINYTDTNSIEKKQLFGFLQQITQETHSSLQQKKYKIDKIWNSGYFMLNGFSQHFDHKSKAYRINKFLIYILSPVLLLCQIIIPCIFFILESNKEAEHYFIMVTFIIFSSFYAYIIEKVLINSYKFMHESVQSAIVFTNLLESRKTIKKFNLKNDIPTINIACVLSIQTWRQVKEIFLNVIHSQLVVLNVIQTLDIVLILLICVALLLDYEGNLWKKQFIINSRILLSIACTNIIQKIFCSIIVTFSKFSETNLFLKYNQVQIYSILQKLQYLESIYSSLRKVISQTILILMQRNLEETEININQDTDSVQAKEMIEQEIYNINQQQNQKNTVIQCESVSETLCTAISEDMKTLSIYEIKLLIEIKRNALQFNNSRKYEDFTKDEQMKNEIIYLKNLQKVYQIMSEDMKSNEKKYLIKFLNLLPLEYGMLYAILFIPLPSFLSYFIKLLLQ